MIETGKTFIQSTTVELKDTAVAYGSGKLEVYATPAMIGFMENTAVKCLEGMLDADSDTVGIAINVKHTKATAVGKKIFCKAIITEVDGRRIHFDIEAWDEKENIGTAVHDRFIIHPEKFMSKL